MKKVISIFFITILSVCFLFEGCGKMSDRDYVSKIIKLSLPQGATIVAKNTHSGFLGDGTYFAKITFSAVEIKPFLEKIKANKWQPLPLKKDIDALLYGGTINGIEYADFLAKEVGMPKVKNGYWTFVDRNTEKSTELLERYSYNFDLAIFDTDTNTLYVYQLDT
ncbi:MAG: hypothetical protein Q8876_01485 [Bacillota bacterium]|nr:hypothetical protein [Bacillota bacterium]